MKRMILLLFLFTFSLSGFAVEASNPEKFLRCSRKLIQTRKFTESLIMEIVELTKNFKTEAAVLRCQQMLKEDNQNDKLNIEEAYALITGMQLSEKMTEFLINDFLLPTYDCKAKGINVGFSYYLGTGVGVLVAKCTSTDGGNYRFVLPEIELNGGMGAFALYEIREFEIYPRIRTENGVVTIKRKTTFGSAVAFVRAGIGIAGGFNPEDIMEPGPDHEVGVGVGLMLNVSVNVAHIKVAKLGNDFTPLIQFLENNRE